MPPKTYKKRVPAGASKMDETTEVTTEVTNVEMPQTALSSENEGTKIEAINSESESDTKPEPKVTIRAKAPEDQGNSNTSSNTKNTTSVTGEFDYAEIRRNDTPLNKVDLLTLVKAVVVKGCDTNNPTAFGLASKLHRALNFIPEPVAFMGFSGRGGRENRSERGSNSGFGSSRGRGGDRRFNERYQQDSEDHMNNDTDNNNPAGQEPTSDRYPPRTFNGGGRGRGGSRYDGFSNSGGRGRLGFAKTMNTNYISTQD